MCLEFKFITEEEFNSTVATIVFNNIETKNRYGIISMDEYDFIFGWQSDLIDPMIVKINSKIYCIGIDLNFAIVDFNNNSIPVNIELNSFFGKTILLNNSIIVINETEIMIINNTTYDVVEYGFPDLIVESELRNNVLNIKCMDGTSDKILLN